MKSIALSVSLGQGASVALVAELAHKARPKGHIDANNAERPSNNPSKLNNP